MSNIFDRFYDTTVEIYKLEKGGYEDGDTKTYLGSVTGDLQPHSSYVMDHAYGLSERKEYKFYTDKYPIVRTGNLVLLDNMWYRIVGVYEWSMGLSATIKGIDDEN